MGVPVTITLVLSVVIVTNIEATKPTVITAALTMGKWNTYDLGFSAFHTIVMNDKDIIYEQIINYTTLCPSTTGHS